MLMFKEILETANFSIVQGSNYTHSCYGPNSRIIRCMTNHGILDVVFDSDYQTVYEILVMSKFPKDQNYKWIHPSYRNNQKTTHSWIDAANSTTDSVVQNVWVHALTSTSVTMWSDIIHKSQLIMNGFDTASQAVFELELNNDEFLKIAFEAHARDVTINTVMLEIIEKNLGT